MPNAACCASRCAIFCPTAGRPNGRGTVRQIAEAIEALWRDMAGQGLAALGSDAAEAGLREIVAGVRGTGTRLLPGAAARRGRSQPGARHPAIEHRARAARRSAPGQGHDRRGARRLRWRCIGRPGRDAWRHAVGKGLLRRRRADGDAPSGLHRRARRRGGGRKRRAGIDDAGHAGPRRAAVLRAHLREHAGGAV